MKLTWHRRTLRLSHPFKIARRLDLAGEETPAAEAVREGVRRWLAERDDCLLILDSVDDPTRAAPYLPPTQKAE